MKLTIKELAPYLPYGVKVEYNMNFSIRELTGIDSLEEIYLQTKDGDSSFWYEIHGFKPILRPLADLMVGVDFNEETIHKIQCKGIWAELSLSQWETVFQFHYDIFGLIEQNLAIDIKEVGEL